MSSIPNSAMPHVQNTPEHRARRRERLSGMLAQGRRWAGDRYAAASRTARNHPTMTASALGAALLAALGAAFGPRLWRRRSALGL